jgi:hypothetical protein
MNKYVVHVSEVIDHRYEIWADSKDDAREKFDNLSMTELITMDMDGQSSWDTPWDIEEIPECESEGEM